MGFFSDIGNAFKSLGQKTLKGAGYLLDKGIQGAKIATDYADKYTLGLDHFIPYYSALKSGIDIGDHIRKMVKGEESLNWSNALEMGIDGITGAMSLHGGKAELEGLKGASTMFSRARATGSSLGEATKIAGGRALRGYGLHKEQLKDMGREGLRGIGSLGRALRKGDPKAVIGSGLALGSVAVVNQGINEEAQNKSIVPPPKIVPPPINIIVPPPNPPTPINNKLVITKYGVFQNGRMVG
jgi:hypothetical protein